MGDPFDPNVQESGSDVALSGDDIFTVGHDIEGPSYLWYVDVMENRGQMVPDFIDKIPFYSEGEGNPEDSWMERNNAVIADCRGEPVVAGSISQPGPVNQGGFSMWYRTTLLKYDAAGDSKENFADGGVFVDTGQSVANVVAEDVNGDLWVGGSSGDSPALMLFR